MMVDQYRPTGTRMRIGVFSRRGCYSELFLSTMERAGHICYRFSSEELFRKNLRRETYDLIAFADMGEHSFDQNLQLALKLIKGVCPAIIVEEYLSDSNVVLALENGMDDCLVGAYSSDMICAKIDAVFRKVYGARNLHDLAHLEAGGIDEETKSADIDGLRIQFVGKELDLMRHLVCRINSVMSRSHLLDLVWGREDRSFSRTLDTYIVFIRKKLSLDEYGEYQIKSIYGVGYKLEKIKKRRRDECGGNLRRKVPPGELS